MTIMWFQSGMLCGGGKKVRWLHATLVLFTNNLKSKLTNKRKEYSLMKNKVSTQL